MRNRTTRRIEKAPVEACTTALTGGAFEQWEPSYVEVLRLQARLSPRELGTAADPLVRWHAARAVASTRRRCEQEDDAGRAVLEAVAVCLKHGLVAPTWLSAQFGRRVEPVLAGRALSWDEPDAFGKPWPAYTRRAVVTRDAARLPAILAAAHELREREPDRSIDRNFFNELARRMDAGLSGGATERLYYRALREGAVGVQARKAARQLPAPGG